MCANYIPWSAAAAEASEKAGRGRLDLSYDRWVRYHEEKQRELERVQRQQSPAVFASPKAAGLYLMKYGCLPLVVN
jgi:hypothetical protein|tara:strand:- start:440 stop:667 length:228 start_codon:yes stop_codon:yes gene_type:complete